MNASRASVALFGDSFTPIMDGVTVVLHNYATWLARVLGPTCVITPRVPGHRDREAYPVIRFFSLPTVVRPPYRIGLPDVDLRLPRRLQKLGFSIVHAHSPFGAGRTAARVARERGVPFVATFHSKFREDLARLVPVRRIVDDEVRRIVELFHAADQVWVPQKAAAATLREYGYTGPCEVVENGIDFDPPADTSVLRDQGGRLLGIPSGCRVGLFVGRLALEKNLEFLLRSLSPVMSAIPDFRMALVGNGYASCRLHGLARRLGLADRIVFHPMVYDREALKAIYARGDLLLFPSLYDNAPLVVREAAALGTPSIFIRGATAAEPIKDCENGFLADNDPEAFGNHVVQLLDDPAAIRRAGAGARRTLCRTWESVAREVRDRYLSLIEGCRSKERVLPQPL